MSDWAYRTCCECGGRVHTGFLCRCGNDPWDIEFRLKNSINAQEKALGNVCYEVAWREGNIKLLEEKLKWLKRLIEIKQGEPK